MNILQNVYKHPVSTVAGLLLAAALSVSHQPDWHHLLAAFGAALLGAVAKEK